MEANKQDRRNAQDEARGGVVDTARTEYEVRKANGQDVDEAADEVRKV